MTPSDRAGVERRGLLARLFAAEPGEMGAVGAGFALFFLVFMSYFMLRPVRETMGVAGGVDNLQWLFTGTFIASLSVVPIYGALSARVPRRRLLPIAYCFVAATLAGFGFAMQADPDNVWTGRGFYVWLSVLNLFVISIGWSLMADIFRPAQAKRLFGQIAAGASLGGLAGPLASGLLVEPIGHSGLLFLSAALLVATLFPVRLLLAFQARANPPEAGEEDPARAMGGSIIAGLTLILRSPYLLMISLFVLLLVSISTFLYFEQARMVDELFPDRVRQTQVFSMIDVAVQSLTIFIQLFLTGRIARRLGVATLLSAIPIAMTFGFMLLAAAPTFTVLVLLMVFRRVGEYALVRPGREILFTAVDAETKYKAKNAIDTVVYRGGDAASAWIKTGVDALSQTHAAAALVGAGIAAAWAATGLYLGRRHDRRTDGVLDR